MRHRNSVTRLTQKPAHARMLKRNLVTSFLLYESVRTTKMRAKAIQPMVDRLITIAKTRPPHVAIRAINRVVTDKNASRKIMEVYAKRFADVSSGLTNVVAAGMRKGDGAQLVDMSFVGGVDVAPPPPKEKATKKPKTTKKKTTAKKEEAPKKSETSESKAK